MAVEIIKRRDPRKDPSRKIRFKCDCGCVFDATSPDYARVFDQRDGDYYSATCPECNNAVTLSVKAEG